MVRLVLAHSFGFVPLPAPKHCYNQSLFELEILFAKDITPDVFPVKVPAERRLEKRRHLHFSIVKVLKFKFGCVV